MIIKFEVFALVSCLCFLTVSRASLPVVLWHGMGDSCCAHGSLGRLIEIIKQKIPDAEVLSLRFGNNTFEDISNSYLLNVNKQVEMACKKIRANPKMKNGYNAIGFSQGGQFLRAVAQRCPDPPMRYLISLGGQHQGVYGFPKCSYPSSTICNLIRRLLYTTPYLSWVQDTLVQAEYWHDPLHEDVYKKYSVFLSDINNEKEVKNMSYVENLKKLHGLVLVLFKNDSMVVPRESSWFGFFAPGQSKTILDYDKTELYEKDTIGLKELVNTGKVDFLSVDGDHLQFTEEWFTEEIVQRYLM